MPWVRDRRPEMAVLRLCRTGCCGRRSSNRVGSGIRLRTGVGSFGRASAKVNVTTRSPLWPGICSGTGWTPGRDGDPAVLDPCPLPAASRGRGGRRRC
jgi:hypothetical protein